MAADAEAILLAIASTARTFLLSHWHRWHENWGPPAPSLPSQWTCVRSSLFLAQVLERQGIAAALCSGRPVDDDGFGLLTDHGWESHCWVEAEGFVIDITADQFDHAPVVVTPRGDPAYRSAAEEADQLAPTRAGRAAVADMWPSWCRDGTARELGCKAAPRRTGRSPTAPATPA
jgi:hypothetical protein